MKAFVLGGTGLVGRCMVRLLLADPLVDEVRIWVRRPTGVTQEKLRERIVDFENLAKERDALVGIDEVYSALGTTIKIAGAPAAQYRVDHDYQLQTAKLARESGVPSYALVSAMGANPRSLVFYSRMKGELEGAIEALGFPNARILRPGLLEGERAEVRPGEVWAQRLLSWVPETRLTASLRPIRDEQVARAALHANRLPAAGFRVHEAYELFEFSRTFSAHHLG